MEPPYAERHVRWCERTHGGLIPMLLLDDSVAFISTPKPARSEQVSDGFLQIGDILLPGLQVAVAVDEKVVGQ